MLYCQGLYCSLWRSSSSHFACRSFNACRSPLVYRSPLVCRSPLGCRSTWFCVLRVGDSVFRVGRMTMHRVRGLIIVIRIALVLLIKRPLALLLWIDDLIRLLIIRDSGRIRVLRSRIIGRLRPLWGRWGWALHWVSIIWILCWVSRVVGTLGICQGTRLV